MPVFVVTHNAADPWCRDDAPFTLVTDGVESAVALDVAVAGDGIVGVGAADSVQQRVNASLRREAVINLAMVIGDSIRAAARRRPLRVDRDRSLLSGLGASGPRRRGAAHLSYGQDNTCRACL
jgi:hypothetical protein